MPPQSTPTTYQSPKTTNWPMIILGILGVIIIIGIFFVIAVNKDVIKSDLSRKNVFERGSSVLDPYLKNYEEAVILDSGNDVEESDVEESVVEEWTVFSTIDLKANNQLVGQGGFIILSANQSLNLSWSSSLPSPSTASCNLSGWGSVPLNGFINYPPSHLQYPSTSGKTYTLRCSSANVTISDSVTVGFDSNSTFNPSSNSTTTTINGGATIRGIEMRGFAYSTVPNFTNGVLDSAYYTNDNFRKDFCNTTSVYIPGYFDPVKGYSTEYRIQLGTSKRFAIEVSTTLGGFMNGIPVTLKSTNSAVVSVTPETTSTNSNVGINTGDLVNLQAPAVFTITANSIGTAQIIATANGSNVSMPIIVKRDTVRENWLCSPGIITLYIGEVAREITALNGVSPGGETYTLPSSIANKNMSVVTNRTATCKASTQRRTEFSDMPLTFATTDGKTHTFQLGTQGIYYRCKETASGIADAFDYYLT